MPLAAFDVIRHFNNFSPNKLATIDLASGRRRTYPELHDRVGRVAAMLKARGIEKGDRVAFLALNSTDIIDVVYGCWRMGATCLALNFRLTPHELNFIIDNAAAKAVVYDHMFTPIVDALKDMDLPVEHWIGTDGMGGESEFEKSLAAVTEPVLEMEPQSIEDQCMLMYSSGTTGMPKGVIITHAMIAFAVVAGGIAAGRDENDVSLSNMPLFHIGALGATCTPAIHGGGTTAVDRMFDPAKTLEYLNDPELGITTLFMVPAAYNAIRALPQAETADYSRIRVAVCGAETVPTELIDWWAKHGITIQEGYGMTETTAAGCLMRKEDVGRKVGSAGRALMHSQIKIVDESGQTCAPNVPGEIMFRGATITPGYWRRPEANEESFVDGWFRSGDIGRMDEDGYIYIEDRIKDMYISGGENVYPAEIENLVYQLPQIAEAAVIGVPDSKWGETGCVVAALKPGSELTLQEVITHVDGKLSKYKWPGHIHIVKELPRNGTGKVLKFELRESVTALLDLK